MLTKRTDLALEAKELWEESAQEQTQLSGVQAEEQKENGFKITTVRILDERGAKELCKPIGTYITVELDALLHREDDAFAKGANLLSGLLRGMLHLGEKDTVLVVGLGNRAITPDNIGPGTLEHTLVTRHLVEGAPEHFADFRKVAALEPGVLGTTGMESGEVIRAVVEKIRPGCVVAVDALASRSLSRLCRTVQIADTGIVPGSGVGNTRAALSKETLGVDVIALGVPTVVDAGTLAADMLEQTGTGRPSRDELEEMGSAMIVTPREIDQSVRDISKFLGYGLNLALHDGVTIGDIDLFLS